MDETQRRLLYEHSLEMHTVAQPYCPACQEAEKREGTRLRDEGIKRADEHAAAGFSDEALAAVKRLALALPEFTADSVWWELQRVGITTHEHRALGAVMRRAAKDGLIAPTDRYEQSGRKQAHRRPMRIWRSLL